jgi:hypothetical protein
MRTILTIIGKCFLVAFVLWHMFAVAIYSTPRDAKDDAAQWIMADLIPIVRPYMMLTSQWQLWNLFAPDPLRRVTSYRFEVKHNNRWRELTTIHTGTYSIWRHSANFKLLGNIIGEFEKNRSPVAGRFMHLLCKEYALPATTQIRLKYVYYIIPKNESPASRAWWDAWEPRPASYVGYTTSCPEQL